MYAATQHNNTVASVEPYFAASEVDALIDNENVTFSAKFNYEVAPILRYAENRVVLECLKIITAGNLLSHRNSDQFVLQLLNQGGLWRWRLGLIFGTMLSQFIIIIVLRKLK